ncbi:cytochrome c4 [Rhodanobacter panaciterrae]|uniref:Cytochrome c4 n=1 Tax=Rhodanobacter panaciterrae TaxID=490572 RepID=A0ABQ2ZSF8_9GAMM|nr:c-type cytochrome [Rhodanobacter panaciterrae]GGY23208.1 cytochrome c4 [Rhodanobacter panaciterrae]
MSSTHRVLHLVAAVILWLPAFSIAAAEGPPAHTPATWTDLRQQQPITGDVQAGQAKSAVCAACHGPQGLAIVPIFPNLAGQSATYLYVQLMTFKNGQRNDLVMSGQAAALSDADMRNLAAYYASLPAKPAGQADAASRGGRLFLDGDPAQGVPPCQGCHGPTGQGPRVYPSNTPQPPWSTFPRLHGQSAIYVTKALGDFSNGTRSGTSNAQIMHNVAQTLGDADIQALSTYIATQ